MRMDVWKIISFFQLAEPVCQTVRVIWLALFINEQQTGVLPFFFRDDTMIYFPFNVLFDLFLDCMDTLKRTAVSRLTKRRANRREL